MRRKIFCLVFRIGFGIILLWLYCTARYLGGWLATKLGGTRIFGFALLLASILTLLTPVAARSSVYALIILRVLEGVVLVSVLIELIVFMNVVLVKNCTTYFHLLYYSFQGVLFPSNHAIWGQWAPPLERSRLFSDHRCW